MLLNKEQLEKLRRSCPHCKESIYTVLFVSKGTTFGNEGEWPYNIKLVTVDIAEEGYLDGS